MSENYIQLLRSEKTDWLQEHFPNAFLLLSVIARQARRTPHEDNGLEIGDAIIGEIETSKKAGLNPKAYRLALEKLEELYFIETVYNSEWNKKSYLEKCDRKHEIPKIQKKASKRAIKSKIVCLINSEVYDINPKLGGEQKGDQRAIEGRQTKNVKNEKEVFFVKKENEKEKSKVVPVSFSDLKNQEIIDTLQAYSQTNQLCISITTFERWLPKYGEEILIAQMGYLSSKKDTIRNHEAWMEKSLQSIKNFNLNREFIEHFKRKHNIYYQTL
jgi:hypothetical protein